MQVLHRFVIIVDTFFRLAGSNFISNLETVKQVVNGEQVTEYSLIIERGHVLDRILLYFDRGDFSDAVQNTFVLSSFG